MPKPQPLSRPLQNRDPNSTVNASYPATPFMKDVRDEIRVIVLIFPPPTKARVQNWSSYPSSRQLYGLRDCITWVWSFYLRCWTENNGKSNKSELVVMGLKCVLHRSAVQPTCYRSHAGAECISRIEVHGKMHGCLHVVEISPNSIIGLYKM